MFQYYTTVSSLSLIFLWHELKPIYEYFIRRVTVIIFKCVCCYQNLTRFPPFRIYRSPAPYLILSMTVRPTNSCTCTFVATGYPMISYVCGVGHASSNTNPFAEAENALLNSLRTNNYYAAILHYEGQKTTQSYLDYLPKLESLDYVEYIFTTLVIYGMLQSLHL